MEIAQYQFNTGVRPFDHYPPAGMAFMKGFRDSGNGVYVIPFECEKVPNNYKFFMACDVNDYNLSENVIVREILSGSAMNSKYAYFKKTGNND